MEPCILDRFVVHRTTACVACVKEQNLCISQIKEKHSPVYYLVQLAAVLGTVQGQTLGG